MTDDGPLVSAADLARTYRPPDGGDTREPTEDYERAVGLAAREPALDARELASRLDLPRSRVRRWVGEGEGIPDGGRIRNPDGRAPPPEALRGVRAAVEKGWVPLDYESRAFRAMNRLVARTLSNGGIREGFVPAFGVEGGADRSRLIGSFDDLGIDYAVENGPDGGIEHRPITHPAVLGRVLSLLGAPVGERSEGSVRLPAYLDRAPASIRHEFADVYLRTRGGRDGGDAMTLREDPFEGYGRDLAAFVADAGGETAIGREA